MDGWIRMFQGSVATRFAAAAELPPEAEFVSESCDCAPGEYAIITMSPSLSQVSLHNLMLPRFSASRMLPPPAAVKKHEFACVRVAGGLLNSS